MKAVKAERSSSTPFSSRLTVGVDTRERFAYEQAPSKMSKSKSTAGPISYLNFYFYFLHGLRHGNLGVGDLGQGGPVASGKLTPDFLTPTLYPHTGTVLYCTVPLRMASGKAGSFSLRIGCLECSFLDTLYHPAVQCLQCCAVQYSTVQYSTVQYCTSTVLLHLVFLTPGSLQLCSSRPWPVLNWSPQQHAPLRARRDREVRSYGMSATLAVLELQHGDPLRRQEYERFRKLLSSTAFGT